MKIISFKLKIAVAFIGVSLMGTTVQAQSVESACKSNPHFNDFDFWLGEWTVTDRVTGSFQGANLIEKVEDGCLIKENWTSAGGGTGFSMNYYNPNINEWRQLWVSAGAYSIDYKGGLKDGSMVMHGHMNNFTNGETLPFRGTWTPLKDGTVRQFFEVKPSGSDRWATWFDGIYRHSSPQ